jgi:hypothetical protein
MVGEGGLKLFISKAFIVKMAVLFFIFPAIPVMKYQEETNSWYLNFTC